MAPRVSAARDDFLLDTKTSRLWLRQVWFTLTTYFRARILEGCSHPSFTPFPASNTTMKPFHLYIDSADLDELSQCLPHPVIHGVTTNPTILKRAGVTRAALPGLFEKLFKLGVKQVQAQVHAATTDAMLEDARTLLAGPRPTHRDGRAHAPCARAARSPWRCCRPPAAVRAGPPRSGVQMGVTSRVAQTGR